MKFVILLALTSLYTTDVYAQRITSSDTLFVFPEEIPESSGIVISTQNPGILWTHNDSGNDPIVYGVYPKYGIVAKINLLEVEGRDIEDIAIAPCSRETPNKQCLFIADIGDNIYARGTKDVDYPKVYIVEEPIVSNTNPAMVYEYNVTPKVLRISYEGNIPYNAEAFAITRDLDFLVITKGDKDQDGYDKLAKLYRVPYSTWIDNYNTSDPLVMKYEDTLFEVNEKADQVTAATYLDGVLAVKTYSSIYFFKKTTIINLFPTEESDDLRLTRYDWVQSKSPCHYNNLRFNSEALDMIDHENFILSSEDVTKWGTSIMNKIKKIGAGMISETKGVIVAITCEPV